MAGVGNEKGRTFTPIGEVWVVVLIEDRSARFLEAAHGDAYRHASAARVPRRLEAFGRLFFALVLSNSATLQRAKHLCEF
jgi:hypothetical protein